MAVEVDDKIQLGIKVRMARDATKLSQRQAARSLGITNASLSDIENGNNFPSETTILRIVELYKPLNELKFEIYRIYSKAKDAPPPDINAFLKDKMDLHELIREIILKEILREWVESLRTQIRSMEDKKNDCTE